MAIERETKAGSKDSVEPTDMEHRIVRLEWWKDEILRRFAILEKRALILEGKRAPNRLDDAKEWGATGVSRETETETETARETAGVKPWEAAGMSKATWYRRQGKPESEAT